MLHGSRPSLQHFTVCRPPWALLDKRTPSLRVIGVPTGGQNERGGQDMEEPPLWVPPASRAFSS